MRNGADRDVGGDMTNGKTLMGGWLGGFHSVASSSPGYRDELCCRFENQAAVHYISSPATTWYLRHVRCVVIQLEAMLQADWGMS